MALQSPRKHLRTLDTKSNAIVFDRGYGRLRDPRGLSELILAQFLKLAKNTNRFPNRNFNASLRGTIVIHHALR